MGAELKDVGAKLDIDGDDIEAIRARRRKDLVCILLGGAAVMVFSTILGYLCSFIFPGIDIIEDPESYPYACVPLLSSTLFQRNRKFFIIASIVTAIASIVLFLTMFLTFRQNYSLAPGYAVFSRE